MKWTIVLLLVATLSFQTSYTKCWKLGQTQPQRGRYQANIVPGNILPEKHQPMYLRPQAVPPEFYPKNEGGNLIFRNNESIELYCEKNFKYPNATQQILTATYVTDITFKIENEETKLSEIQCYGNPTVVAREKGTCGSRNEGTLFEIGYNITSRGFIRIYEICFNSRNKNTIYVKHIIKPGILGKGKSDRTSFRELLTLDNYRFKSHYSMNNTKALDRNNQSITRGHLAPKGDFFYGVEQFATFVYPNIAPQWSDFNQCNWDQLERVTRSNLNNKILECYTGVIGIMKWINGSELYLYDESIHIPVPELFFRALYEPATMKAVVFLGLNDVFYQGEPKTVCSNIISELNEITLTNITNISEGYLYACEFREFQDKYQLLPSINYPAKSILFKRN